MDVGKFGFFGGEVVGVRVVLFVLLIYDFFLFFFFNINQLFPYKNLISTMCINHQDKCSYFRTGIVMLCW